MKEAFCFISVNYCNKTLIRKNHELNKIPRPPLLSTVRYVKFVALVYR